MQPYRLLIGAYLRRSAAVWVGLRLLLVCVALPTGSIAALATLPFAITTRAAIFMVFLVVTLSAVDIARRRERALLENLAVPVALAISLCAIPALLGEVAVRLVLGPSR